jgi:hypothetical protein
MICLYSFVNYFFREVDRRNSYDWKEAFVTNEVLRQSLVQDQFSSSKQLNYHLNKFNWTQSWCPMADCQGTGLCYPCQRRWLVILAEGRSGSTTLTEMIATLPGVRMAGENKDAIGKYYSFQKDVEKGLGNPSNNGGFRHQPIPPETWSCLSQHLFEVINPPSYSNLDDETTILGFKTVRLHEHREKYGSTNHEVVTYLKRVRTNASQ